MYPPLTTRHLEQVRAKHPSLVDLALTAPHDCDVVDCPGRENKRKLAIHAEMSAWDKGAVSRVLKKFDVFDELVETLRMVKASITYESEAEADAGKWALPVDVVQKLIRILAEVKEVKV